MSGLSEKINNIMSAVKTHIKASSTFNDDNILFAFPYIMQTKGATAFIYPYKDMIDPAKETFTSEYHSQKIHVVIAYQSFDRKEALSELITLIGEAEDALRGDLTLSGTVINGHVSLIDYDYSPGKMNNSVIAWGLIELNYEFRLDY